MKNNLWQSLQRGDLVDIVAPGMPVPVATVTRAKAFLKTWGLVGRTPRDLFGKDVLCANSREKRESHLVQALLAKDSKAVWCVRGGYGSFELLPALRKIRRVPAAKAFLGLSDITSLHHFLQQNWGWATLHASNIDRYALGTVAVKESRRLRGLLFGETPRVEFSLKPMNDKARGASRWRGVVTGGNLITSQATVGTDFQMQARGKIVFFEDIGERGYKVDRVLKHFSMLKMFTGVKAIVFGDFVGGREGQGPSKVPRVLQNFAASQSRPVFRGLPCGHGPVQMPLPFGSSALLCGGDAPILRVQAGSRQRESLSSTSAVQGGRI